MSKIKKRILILILVAILLSAGILTIIGNQTKAAEGTVEFYTNGIKKTTQLRILSKKGFFCMDPESAFRNGFFYCYADNLGIKATDKTETHLSQLTPEIARMMYYIAYKADENVEEGAVATRGYNSWQALTMWKILHEKNGNFEAKLDYLLQLAQAKKEDGSYKYKMNSDRRKDIIEGITAYKNNTNGLKDTVNSWYNKAKVAAQVTTDSKVLINSNNAEYKDGWYGPINIDYPQAPDSTLKISLNNKDVSNERILKKSLADAEGTTIRNINSRENFYIYIGNDISNKNTLKVSWGGYAYIGEYELYTPVREGKIRSTCSRCGSITTRVAYYHISTDNRTLIKYGNAQNETIALREKGIFTKEDIFGPKKSDGTYDYKNGKNGMLYGNVGPTDTWWRQSWNDLTGNKKDNNNTIIGNRIYCCTQCNNKNITINYNSAIDDLSSDTREWPFGYEAGTQDLIYIVPDKKYVSDEEEFEFNIKEELEFSINKVDQFGNKVEGVKFDITVENGTLQGGLTQVEGNGKFVIETTSAVPYVKIKLKENANTVPEGYIPAEGETTLVYKLDNHKWIYSEADSVLATGYTLQGKNKLKLVVQNERIIPNLDIQLDKKDQYGKDITGIKFDINIENGTTVDNVYKVEGNQKVVIKPALGKDIVKVNVKEDITTTPVNYQPIEETTTLVYKLNKTTWQWEYSKNDSILASGYTLEANNNFKLNIENKKVELELTVNKLNQFGDKVDGVKFDVTVENGTLPDNLTQITGNGTYIIEPTNVDNSVIIKLKENTVPEGYIPTEGETILVYKLDNHKWTYSEADSVLAKGYTLQKDNNLQIIVQNEKIISDINLQLDKKDQYGNNVTGVKFDISIENGTTVDNLYKVDGNQKVVIKPALGKETVKINIKEDITTTPVNYKPAEGTTTLVYKLNKTTWEWEYSKNDSALAAGYTLETDNIFKLNIENEILKMNLSGKVWLDEQHGIKPVVAPNDIYDAKEKENLLPGIKVTLRRVADGSEVRSMLTGEKGEYEFTDIKMSRNADDKYYHYYIEFEYEGINYKAVATNVGNDDSIDSDAADIDRDVFNNKFATIIKDKAQNSGIDLEYNLDDTSATLITRNEDGTIKDEFKMKASTLQAGTIYTSTTENIDLGLVKKEVDLAAVTDLEKAYITINGKSQEMTYDYIKNLPKDENGNPVINGTEEEATYNIYLHTSDYNYRINDYVGLTEVNSKIEEAEKTALQAIRTADGALRIDLTYKVLLNNQSAQVAKVNEIAYYYDANLILINKQDLNIVSESTLTMDGRDYKKVVIKCEKGLDKFEQATLELKFTVNKNADNKLVLGEFKNWVEITSYNAGGCIDKNSAPDNMLIHRTENDTDDAGALNVAIKPEYNRTITGYVFEDKKTNGQDGDGLYVDGTDEKVNDVIVQLIEIKKWDKDGDGEKETRLEYIWQETIAGTNKVNCVTTDGTGKGIREYTGEIPAGQYTFNQFIPGDYIVRFIYGDGTYYDKDIEENSYTEEAKEKVHRNIEKYNGQSYKSTIDKHYNAEKFIQENYAENASMARDNEARRLEEMAYIIGGGNTADLSKTWMCAETSLIGIEIGKDSSNNINFGIIKRADVSLKLEKHVTRLYVQDFINVTADINNYIRSEDGYKDRYFVKINDTSANANIIMALATNKDETTGDNHNRIGKWEASVDSPNALRGKKMDLTYTYKIHASEEKEYIGPYLKAALEANELYTNIASAVKTLTKQEGYHNTIGKYISRAYYAGVDNKADDDEEIVTNTEVKIEDYLRSEENPLAIVGTTFTENGTIDKPVINKNNNVGTENVRIISTTKDDYKAGEQVSLDLTLPSIDDTKSIEFRSYVAKLIPKETITATGLTIEEIPYVQTYYKDTNTTEVAPKDYHNIAETIILSQSTGGTETIDKILMITSVAIAVAAIIATGVILIKQNAIENIKK